MSMLPTISRGLMGERVMGVRDLGRRSGCLWPAARRTRSRSGSEEVEGASHNDVRHVVDDEVRGARHDLHVEGVDVVLHAVDELRAHFGSSAPRRTRVCVLSRLSR